MAVQEAEGIILRKYLLRETSYILVIHTREFGKIRGVLKGARAPYPQFAGNFEIFTRAKVLFYRKKRKTMDLITGCETIDFFLHIRKDIERLTYANYFIELVDVVTTDGDANEELYDALLEGLALLASECSPKRITRIFEIKLLNVIGLAPKLDGCLRCSSDDGADVYRFSVQNGGVLCRGCAEKGTTTMAVSKGTVNFMRKICDTPFVRARQIKVSREVGREAENILKNFIQYHIGRRMRSMKFLEEIQRKGVLEH